jgi:exopolysaccharide production protein ExoZ
MSSIPIGASLASEPSLDRVAGFDLLRGICALAVVFHHVLSWHGAAHLYNLGTYAVYIFFVLSGASMHVAYAHRFARGYPVGRFLALRYIRLAPLYILGLVLAAGYRIYKGEYTADNVGNALLNAALLFGLANPGATSEVAGGWSIGIEFVFYLVFPVVLALTTSRRWVAFVLVAFVAQHIFINTALGGRALAAAWPLYTQPMAFVFYFVAGCAIGRALEEGKLRGTIANRALFVGCLAAIGLTSGATSENSLTGMLGVTLSALSAIVVATSAPLTFSVLGHKVAAVLGKASYGVYILHPWVWAVVAWAGRTRGADPLTIAVTTAAISVPIAIAVHQWFEQPLQVWAKTRLRPEVRTPES